MFNPVVPKHKEMLQYDYARSALGLGLKLEDKLGVNPFKFGMIGSRSTPGHGLYLGLADRGASSRAPRRLSFSSRLCPPTGRPWGWSWWSRSASDWQGC